MGALLGPPEVKDQPGYKPGSGFPAPVKESVGILTPSLPARNPTQQVTQLGHSCLTWGSRKVSF